MHYLVSSHRSHENRGYESSPHQGPSRGTAGHFQDFQKYSRLLTYRGGVPTGAAVFISNN